MKKSVEEVVTESEIDRPSFLALMYQQQLTLQKKIEAMEVAIDTMKRHVSVTQHFEDSNYRVKYYVTNKGQIHYKYDKKDEAGFR